MNWWHLPGPERFLEQMIQDVRDGKNVVLYVPEGAPQGLESALQHRMRRDDCPWHSLRADRQDEQWSDPVSLLVSQFLESPGPGELWDISMLLRDDGFMGKYIWIEGLSPRQWRDWKEFIAQYAHACRQVEQFERTIFVIVARGETAQQTVDEDVCLSHYALRNYVGLLDMMLYTRSILPTERLTGLQTQCAISVIARLALWDPAVADALAAEDFPTILQPRPVLERMGRARGWTIDMRVSAESGWRQGACEQVEGAELVHSAHLALAGNTQEIERRIWSGQVGIMLPFIEQERLQILKQLESKLSPPFETPNGPVTDIFQLEIGHIVAQILASNAWVDRCLLGKIQKLHRIRNCLSHVQAVAADEMLGI